MSDGSDSYARTVSAEYEIQFWTINKNTGGWEWQKYGGDSAWNYRLRIDAVKEVKRLGNVMRHVEFRLVRVETTVVRTVEEA